MRVKAKTIRIPHINYCVRVRVTKTPVPDWPEAEACCERESGNSSIISVKPNVTPFIVAHEC